MLFPGLELRSPHQSPPLIKERIFSEGLSTDVAISSKETLFEFLVRKGHIDSETGLVKEEFLSKPLPLLDEASKHLIHTFYLHSVTPQRSFCIRDIFYQIGYHCYHNRKPVRFFMVGSAVPYYLEKYMALTMKEFFEIGEDLYPQLQKERKPPGDIDFRVDIPGATAQELLSFGELIKNYVAHQLYCSVESLNLRNYKYIEDAESSYLITGFDFSAWGFDVKIDITLVSRSPRTYLFNHQKFSIEFAADTLSPAFVSASIQEMVDYECDVLRLDRPEEVNQIGWYSYISELTKGKRSLDKGPFQVLWKKVDPKDLAVRLRKSASSHHSIRQEDNYLFLAYNAFGVFRRQQGQEEADANIAALAAGVQTVAGPIALQNPLADFILKGLQRNLSYPLLRDMLYLASMAFFPSASREVSVEKESNLALKVGPSSFLLIQMNQEGEAYRRVLEECERRGEEKSELEAHFLSFFEQLENVTSSIGHRGFSKDVALHFSKVKKEVEGIEKKRELPAFLQLFIYKIYLFEALVAFSREEQEEIILFFYEFLSLFQGKPDLLRNLLKETIRVLDEVEKRKERRVPLKCVLESVSLKVGNPLADQMSFVTALAKSDSEPMREMGAKLCRRLPLEKVEPVMAEYLKRNPILAVEVFDYFVRVTEDTVSPALFSLYATVSRHLVEKVLTMDRGITMAKSSLLLAPS